MSVCINTIILSLLYKHSPDKCKFILIDPKMLELSTYEGIPHLLCPVITEAKKAASVLGWVVKEMENRYKLMTKEGVRNIDGYNAKHTLPMPYIVVIVDEMSESYLITFTPGTNPDLDTHVNNNEYDWHGWQRLNAEEWDYTAQDEKVWEKRADTPFPSANGIILLQKTGGVS